ncbi:MAG: hypothetical protein Q9174_000035 [Haloplaca sp. 1 TL-2023]
MALPPERIAVKRRREEEPVDALYIPPKRFQTSIVWHRVSNDESQTGIDQVSYSTRKREEVFWRQNPQVPLVKSTCRSATTDDSQRGGTTSVEHDVVKDISQQDINRVEEPRKSSPPPQGAHSQWPSRLAREPRKFHFTRAVPSSRSSSVPNSGIRKAQKKQKKDIALFVERRHGSKVLAEQPFQTTKRQRKYNGVPLHNVTAEATTPRKRPLASAAEQEWRARTWSKPPKSTANVGSDRPGSSGTTTVTDPAHDASMGLAHQLQQFALEATQESSKVPEARKVPVAKVKPKPPKPRVIRQRSAQRENDCDEAGDQMDSSSDHNDAHCFVYDVYLRQAEPTDGKESSNFLANGPDGPRSDKVGMLVIEEDDQEEWLLYREEDQSSDDDWNSEEDDENAEDFYGNDYPEDELDSDDEYDKHTYKHWQGSFDEEDMDSRCWSDGSSRIKQ